MKKRLLSGVGDFPSANHPRRNRSAPNENHPQRHPSPLRRCGPGRFSNFQANGAHALVRKRIEDRPPDRRLCCHSFLREWPIGQEKVFQKGSGCTSRS